MGKNKDKIARKILWKKVMAQSENKTSYFKTTFLFHFQHIKSVCLEQLVARIASSHALYSLNTSIH